MMEPRPSVIQNRLKQVKRVIAVASGKGGVGKSMVASTLALTLAKQGKEVGLLDLDLYGPSAHLILGFFPDGFPDEDKGIIPQKIEGIKFMSLVYFSEDKPAAFRGDDVTNIIIELLAITRWDNLDYLIIDLPPGIGDETLDIISYIPQSEFLVVTTPSKVAFGAVEKLLKMLLEGNHRLLGVVENMVHSPSKFILQNTEDLGVGHLAILPFDKEIETVIGQPSQLLSTAFAKNITRLSKEI
jgi:ATP-binding protein involved in chromosome partitioning